MRFFSSLMILVLETALVRVGQAAPAGFSGAPAVADNGSPGAFNLTRLMGNQTWAPPLRTGTRNDTGLGGAQRDRVFNYYCDSYTYENQVSGASPDAVDCQKIAFNIDTGGGWAWMGGMQHQLASYGTCAFGVEAPWYKFGIVIETGNGDIIEVLIHSIQNLMSADQKVGARGGMRCQDLTWDSGFIDVTWGIYHT